MKTRQSLPSGYSKFSYVIADELGVSAALVYAEIYKYARLRKGVCQASETTIGKRIKMSEKTVRKHRNALVKAGYLIDKTPNLVNHPHTLTYTDLLAQKDPAFKKFEKYPEDDEEYDGPIEGINEPAGEELLGNDYRVEEYVRSVIENAGSVIEADTTSVTATEEVLIDTIRYGVPSAHADSVENPKPGNSNRSETLVTGRTVEELELQAYKDGLKYSDDAEQFKKSWLQFKPLPKGI